MTLPLSSPLSSAAAASSGVPQRAAVWLRGRLASCHHPFAFLHRALAPACLLLSPASASFAPAAESPEPIPQAYPSSRYDPVWDHSPFELEAPPPTNLSPTSPLSEEFALVGITKVKGKTVVTLLDKKAGTSFDIREDQPRNSVRLLEVSVNRDPMLTEVKLAKGSETGSVGYDKKSWSAAPKRPPQALAANQPNPGAAPASALNRSPETPNPAPQVSRRRILSPSGGPALPVAPGGISPQPPGVNPPGLGQPNMAQPLPLPNSTPPRLPPTANDRRNATIPQGPQ